jgi:hypothetical protein
MMGAGGGAGLGTSAEAGDTFLSADVGIGVSATFRNGQLVNLNFDKGVGVRLGIVRLLTVDERVHTIGGTCATH